MAVAYVDSNNDNGNDATGDLVVSGTDRLVIATWLSDGASDPTYDSANFNTSEAMTDIAQTHTTGTGEYQETWYLIAPSVVTAACAVTGGLGEAGIGLAVSGAHQTTPIPTADIQVLEHAGDTQRSANVPNVTADDLVVAIISINGAIAGYTPDGTQREQASGAGWSYVLLTKTGTGTVTIGGSGWSSVRCSIVAFRIAAAGGGGGPSPIVPSAPAQRNRRHTGRFL